MKIGYQLFSALELCGSGEGLEQTIRKIAQMGYDGVEFFSYGGISAGRMKEILAECKVEAINSHVQLERWQKDPEGEILYAREAGIPYVTIPWVAPKLRSAEGFRQIRELCTRLAPLCEEQGVGLLYHNHHFEFEKEEDRYILDSLLEADSRVGLELDTFWAHYAKVKPADYMEKQKERLRLIHVKDYLSLSGGPEAGGMEMPLFAAIGTGKMDNERIFGKAKELGLNWVIVEQDNSQIDVLESARQSLKSLKEAFKDE